MDKIKVSLETMNIILMAIEAGYRACEIGKSKEQALAIVSNLYVIAQPNIKPSYVGLSQHSSSTGKAGL